MDAFHSDDYDNDSQNLLEEEGFVFSRMNSSILGIAYCRETGEVEEDHRIFQDIDSLFETGCKSYSQYRSNLNEIMAECTEEMYREVVNISRKYRGEDV